MNIGRDKGMIHVKLKCKCGIKKFSTDQVSKKDILNLNYRIDCSICEYKCEVLSIKSEREVKLNKIMKRIK